MEELKDKYLVVVDDNEGSVYLSPKAIKHAIINYLGKNPTKETKFESKKGSESIFLEIDKSKLVATIKVLIKDEADLSNNIYLIQEKVRTAILEECGIIPWEISVQVVDSYK